MSVMCVCVCVCEAWGADRGEGVPAGALGGAQAAVRAVHGPAALLQGHGAGGQLDEQTGGTPITHTHTHTHVYTLMSMHRPFSSFQRIMFDILNA